ncbi:hypothetical protein LX32DRAFT_570828 [Colletotrichum zoysiae]|uniref:Protein kinase domain-containing protein n=1 Tax=Colletotrichum zoysiae TaxID=1216348 RepID=A0AAD9LX15_9PEZI|nr:hypothetical protein LX32DRAFT_570828 [Colletotrichum zoysiae]
MKPNTSTQKALLVKTVLHSQYLVLDRMKKFLDQILGSNRYTIKVRSGSFVLYSQRKLSTGEIERLHKNSQEYEMIKDENAVLDPMSDANKSRPQPLTGINKHSTPVASISSSSPPNYLSQQSNTERGTFNKGPRQDVFDLMPCYHSSGSNVQWFDTTMTGNSTIFRGLKIRSLSDERSTTGLYDFEIEAGQTSNIFVVQGQLMSFAPGTHKDGVQKFAIKRLKEKTKLDDFLREYDKLTQVKSLRHPNIVDTLAVFKDESGGVQRYNFVFPLALTNLKRLFRGDKVNVSGTQKSSLWSQIGGLASAVAYLHESRTAHRDIKPSNILVYESHGTDQLELKLTDFGLAVDLSNALAWQEGSADVMSALNYNAPEIRSAFSKTGQNKNGLHSLPSPQQLLSNDIWKLGCVFTELAVFVTRGSVGVSRFRDSIITETANVSSDSFSDVRFDDGERIKAEVLASIDVLASDTPEVSQLQPILLKMLSEALSRPPARAVCQYLTQHASFFGTYPFFDGMRHVRFESRHQNTEIGMFDKCRLMLEARMDSCIDWWPLPKVTRPFQKGDVEVMWRPGKEELSAILNENEARRYKAVCFPALRNGDPVLPRFNTQTTTATATSGTSHSGQTPASPSLQNIGTISTQGSSVPKPQSASPTTRELYWCIDEVFSEPRQTMRRPIPVQLALTDEELYETTNKAFGASVGSLLNRWFLNFLSWKCCVGVDFIKFYIVMNDEDQVFREKTELPPQENLEYDHGIMEPQDVQMKLAAIQIVNGLRDPKSVRGKKDMIRMIPKKTIPPDFQKRMGAYGWGIYAEMGWSLKRMLWWLVFCFVATSIFVVIWLACISKTDLQNAFVPSTIVLGVFTIVLGMAQMLG